MDPNLRHVHVRVWNVSPGQWPERSPSPTAVVGLDDREDLGVAFSGGGTRSAAATLGQLRALHELGWLRRLRYVTAVSGGAWAVVPFTFLPDSTLDPTFLGPMLEPGDLSVSDLDDLDWNSGAYIVSQSKILDDLIRHVFAGDEAYSRALGDVFLRPAGLDPDRRLFTQSVESRAAILARNRALAESDFHVARVGRPFLIVTGTLLRPSNDDSALRRFRFEMTPLYAGVREFFPTAGSNNRPIGGGFVEACGFDSDSPDGLPAAGIVDVRLGARHRFTLSDVVGTTGAAPAWALAKMRLGILGFPEYKYWSPRVPSADDKEYEFGDGGNLENLGVMPLLARKVSRLVVFVNTNHTLVTGRLDEVSDSLPPLFGVAPDGWMSNRVFQASRFAPLMRGLWARMGDGGPAWHRETYEVLDNTLHGIEGGWHADVTWVYNQLPAKWFDRLPASVRDLLGHGEFANFPHYRTFFQNASIIDLSARQVSLLAHMACWSCREALAAANRLASGPAPRRRAERRTRRVHRVRRGGR